MPAFTITGNLKNNGINISGAPIELRTAATGVLLDSDFTNGSGNYSVSGDTSLQVEVWVDKGDPHETSSGALDPENQTYNFTDVPGNPPTLPSIGTQIFTEDTGVQTKDLSIGDTDGDLLTMQKLSGPSWFTSDVPDNTPPPYTGRMYFDTDGVTPDDYSASLRIQDDWGDRSVVRNFTIRILASNVPPVLTNPGPVSYDNDSGLQTLQLVANDPDSGPSSLSYSKVSGPAWGTVNSSTGLITFNTDAAPKGAQAFTWRVSDGEDVDTEGHTVTINNNLPVLTNPGDQTFTKDTGPQTFQLVATDQDDEDTLTFSKVSGDSAITISSTGLVTVDTSITARDPDTEDFEGTGLPTHPDATWESVNTNDSDPIDWDYDRTLVTGADSTWGDECMRAVTGVHPAISMAQLTPDSPIDDLKVEFEAIVASSVGAGDSHTNLLQMFTAGGPGSFVLIRYHGGSGGNLRVHHKVAAGTFALDYSEPMSLDTKEKIAVEWIRGVSFKVWRNDIEIVNETDMLDTNIEKVRFGAGDGTASDEDIFIDNIVFEPSFSPLEGDYPVTARVSDGTATDDESFTVTLLTPDPRPEFHHTG